MRVLSGAALASLDVPFLCWQRQVFIIGMENQLEQSGELNMGAEQEYGGSQDQAGTVSS